MLMCVPVGSARKRVCVISVSVCVYWWKTLMCVCVVPDIVCVSVNVIY